MQDPKPIVDEVTQPFSISGSPSPEGTKAELVLDERIVQNRLRRLAGLPLDPKSEVKFSTEAVYADQAWKVAEALLLQRARAYRVVSANKGANRAQRRA